MLGSSDASIPSNGDSTARSNGATAAARSGSSNVTNGTHKMALSTNGSSNGDKGAAARALRSSDYQNHNREEVTRILIQALSDMGYQDAAESVSRDSGCKLESPTVAAFRTAVLSGSWMEAEQLLLGAALSEVPGVQGNGLVLAAGSDRSAMRFWLRQQKFLELLEQRDTTRALAVLRGELTPLYNDTSKLHFLSSLLMCQSAEDLKAKADWDGAAGNSRRRLLSELSRCISPSVMLPEGRLGVLLQQVKQSQIDTCLYHTAASSPSLYCDHFCSRERFPTEVAIELTNLDGEIWQVQFSHDGSMLAACGSKGQVVIWNSSFEVIQVLRDHDEGVGNISWSPDDSMIVTTSQDRYARLWAVRTGDLIKKTRKYSEPASGCVWTKDGKSFIVGTLDKNHSLCTYNIYDDHVIDWNKKHRVQGICGSSDGQWLVAMDDGTTIHVYNATTRELVYDLDVGARPTSVSISQDCRHILVNKRDGEAQLIDLMTRESVRKFLGHTGGMYQIRSSFGGANESFVCSGSEDGNILIWHKTIGAAVERLRGHEPRCNSVSWKPDDPSMLASCGDDGKVKIWTNKGRSKPTYNNGRYVFAEMD